MALGSPFSQRAEARQQARQAETPASSRAHAHAQARGRSVYTAVPLRRQAAVLVYMAGGADKGFLGGNGP